MFSKYQKIKEKQTNSCQIKNFKLIEIYNESYHINIKLWSYSVWTLAHLFIQWTQLQKCFFFKNLTFSDLQKLKNFSKLNFRMVYYKLVITCMIENLIFINYTHFFIFHKLVSLEFNFFFYSVALPQIVVSNYTLQ